MKHLTISASDLLIIRRLFNIADIALPLDFENTKVEEIGEGGSRGIVKSGVNGLGTKVSSGVFYDTGDTPVFVDLFVDSKNNFHSLDYWKVDFTPINRTPIKPEEVLLSFEGKPLNNSDTN